MAHLTKELAYWITERFWIHERKDVYRLPKPWSDDHIFQTVRFCNVHREDDAVTRWMRENWSDKDSPAWWFVLGRVLNYVPTLEDILDYGISDPDSRGPASLPMIDGLVSGLKARRDSGEKIFTSAYTISTCGKKMDKIDYVMGVADLVRSCEGAFLDESCFEMWQALTQIDGLGSFLAAQVVADMKNTPGHSLYRAPDFWTFSAPGPGSLRGLSWWWHSASMMRGEQAIREKEYAQCLKLCRAEVDPLIPKHIPRISDQDFQNCLCEFSKYCKVKYLGGHVRNRFQGA